MIPVNCFFPRERFDLDWEPHSDELSIHPKIRMTIVSNSMTWCLLHQAVAQSPFGLDFWATAIAHR